MWRCVLQCRVFTRCIRCSDLGASGQCTWCVFGSLRMTACIANEHLISGVRVRIGILRHVPLPAVAGVPAAFAASSVPHGAHCLGPHNRAAGAVAMGGEEGSDDSPAGAFASCMPGAVPAGALHVECRCCHAGRFLAACDKGFGWQQHRPCAMVPVAGFCCQALL